MSTITTTRRTRGGARGISREARQAGGFARPRQRGDANEAPGSETPAPGTAPRAMARRLVEAMKLLEARYEPHACGGFTEDDITLHAGVLGGHEEAWEELLEAMVIRFHAENEREEICYQLDRGALALWEGGGA